MLSLVRVQFKNAICVSRSAVQAALSLTSLNGPGRGVDDILPARAESDKMRAAISYILDSCPTVQHENSSLRIIRAEAKTKSKSEVKIDLHFQKRGGSVNYLHIGSFNYNEGKITFEENWELPGEIKEKIPQELISWTERPQDLLELGGKAFSHDLRKLVDCLLVEKLPRLWAGTWLITSEQLHNVAKSVRQVLSHLTGPGSGHEGQASLNLVTVEDNTENKETIGKELSVAYEARLETAIAELQKLDPNDAKYEDKKAKMRLEWVEATNEAAALQTHLEIEFSDEFFEKLMEGTDCFE